MAMSDSELRSVRIAGWKSIREATVELGRLNVLVGANGAGKSNLLGVFRMMEAMTAQRFRVFVAENARAQSLLRDGPEVTERLALDLEFRLPNEMSMTYSAVWRATADGALYFGEETIRHQARGQTEGTTNSLGKGHVESALVGSDDEDALGANSTLASFVGVRSFHFDNTSVLAPLRRGSPRHDRRSLRSDAANLPSFLLLLQEHRPASYATIRAAIKNVAPFFDDFSLEADPDPGETIQLGWRELGSSAPRFAHQLSDGLLRFIALAVALLQPFDTGPEIRILVIDEPELGLHPAAIHVLAAMLKSAAQKTQVLVSTQSPALVDEFAPEDIVVAERTTGGSEFRRLVPESLTEWLTDYRLGELLEKNVFGGGPGLAPPSAAP